MCRLGPLRRCCSHGALRQRVCCLLDLLPRLSHRTSWIQHYGDLLPAHYGCQTTDSVETSIMLSLSGSFKWLSKRTGLGVAQNPYLPSASSCQLVICRSSQFRMWDMGLDTSPALKVPRLHRQQPPRRTRAWWRRRRSAPSASTALSVPPSRHAATGSAGDALLSTRHGFLILLAP